MAWRLPAAAALQPPPKVGLHIPRVVLTYVNTATAFGCGSIDVRLRQEYLACGMSPNRKGKFMKTLHLLVVAGLLGMGFSAWANPQLADEKQCMQCHSITKDGAGPAFQKIAVRWKGDRSAEKTLVATIRKGSDGGSGRHWGIAKMPDDSERPLVSEAEAKQLVKWILSL
ncbi:c-type cytochrome [Acidovorax sp. JHL-9]|uniref:c-type cytochrome n=1 Tax=Acidovorax sp. JHL-9 TaxID=1276756 RepID=UPI001EE2C80F|nr:c-type cytochrome [Acidovorax sp. JHL-9]